MSKRMSVEALVLTFAADVSGSWPLGRRFLVEADALAFIQRIEAALDGTPVEKPLLSALVADEPKTAVANESLDSTTRHPSLLEHVHVPGALGIKFHSSSATSESQEFAAER
jgi:hypothetical protein